MASFDQIDRDIRRAMLAHRHRFRETLRALREAAAAKRAWEAQLARLRAALDRSIAQCEARQAAVPAIRFEEDLPVAARREEIAEAIRRHQVVIVCGETGSGKSTQLPKICLSIGRGVAGMIGHTQPRRIAARTIAARVAQELGVSLGREVGFKIRFTDTTSPKTLVKLMTDGILLAESQNDRFLEQYDTILIDEAHERSLNIDFLLGCVKRLLPKRRELKLVITSATIDAARFSRHFATPQGPAPIIEVTGRTYPVEVRYRPPQGDDDSPEPDWQRAVLEAVDELAAIDRGDMLIFMPTERDIHETAKLLRGRSLPGDPSGRTTEVLPLYARLSAKDQERVFQAHGSRRIVIATNVAESSLTVPGIRYVIDPGTARISRYSARTKTQRLPIEPVSQASADQRKGRCGRIGPGICIRLFSEADYLARDRYTAPEIQRTNLASVILQTKAMKLGDIERFPFLDPPRADAVRDGYKTLFELGALDERNELTEIGRRLARLPVDPRIGRMILAAAEENCLNEVLIIAAALEVQDPRDRPLEKQGEADTRHAQFADPQSDFLGCLKLWDFYQDLKRRLSRNQLRKACRENFLSYNRMREWLDIHLQLLELVEEGGMKPQPRRDEYASIHRAILTGLLSNVAFRGEPYEYSVAGGGKANVWPGSGVFRSKPKWIMGAELVETSRRYLRTCGRVDPRWIEPIAAHLVRRTYSDPHWDPRSGSAVAFERVSLFGLTVVPHRRVAYGPVDAAAARTLMIQHGLVEGDLDLSAAFFTHNRRLVAEMESLQIKLRRHDLLLGQWAQFDFYDLRIPGDVYDIPRLVKWLGIAARSDRRVLMMSESDIVREPPPPTAARDFPDQITLDQMQLPLSYRFEPGSEEDGVTVTVPLEALNQLDPRRLAWVVPGLLEQKVAALVKSLPKELRRPLVPTPDTARQVAPHIRFGEGCLLTATAAALSRLSGQRIRSDDFQEDKLPNELRMKIRVVNGAGEALAVGRDLGEIRRKLGQQAAVSFAAIHDPLWTRDGLVAWDLDDLPEEVRLVRGGLRFTAYPTLVDRKHSVSLRLADTRERAVHQTRLAVRRLCCLAAARELRTQVDWLPNLDQLAVFAAAIEGFDLREQMAELIAERAFLADASLPRSRAEFATRLGQGKKRLGVAVQDVAALVAPLLEAYHDARLAIEQARAALWRDSVADARGQLAELTAPGFLTATPWEWLQHYPRYFRAISYRLEALGAGSLARDRRGMEEIGPRWEAYVERAREHAELDVFDPELTRFRWMLEELRVSLFAQKLGTSLPVSPKRLDQQWARTRQG